MDLLLISITHLKKINSKELNNQLHNNFKKISKVQKINMRIIISNIQKRIKIWNNQLSSFQKVSQKS